MRRFLALIGAALTTAALGTGSVPALAASGTAAATGTLMVNGVPHTGPHGCFPAGGFLTTVVNQTNRTAYIYPNGGCFGRHEGWVLPGGQATMNGASVYPEGAEVTAVQLPCVFGASLAKLREAVLETDPVLVLSVGLSPRAGISVERVAINVNDSPTPVSEVEKKTGISTWVSQTAGTFVCRPTRRTSRSRPAPPTEPTATFRHPAICRHERSDVRFTVSPLPGLRSRRTGGPDHVLLARGRAASL